MFKFGPIRELMYVSIYDRRVALHGLEAIYRDGVTVGFIRRADFGFTIDKSIAYGYVRHHDGQPVTTDYVKTGQYSIEHLGEAIPARVHLRSPFDPENKRVKGIYTQ